MHSITLARTAGVCILLICTLAWGCPDQTQVIEAKLPGGYRLSGSSDRHNFVVLNQHTNEVVVPRRSGHVVSAADATVTRIAILEEIVVGAISALPPRGVDKYFIMDTRTSELKDGLNLDELKQDLERRGCHGIIEWQLPSAICR